MMPFTILVDPDRPVVICTIDDDFSLERDAAPMVRAVIDAITSQPQPVYHIFDARKLTMTFDEFMEALGAALKQGRPTIQREQLIESFVVTNNNFIASALRGLRAVAFGNLPVRPVASVEEAYQLIEATP